MFGGIGENGTYFGDLWVYDIVRSLWHKILDSPNIYDDDENEEKVPWNRAFFGKETLVVYGSVVVLGGKGEDDIVYCDAWRLDVEKTIKVIENPLSKNLNNLWKKIPTVKKTRDSLCRFGLDTVVVDERNVLIFGGRTLESSDSSPILFDVKTSKFTQLRTLNEPPKNRFYYDVIDSGNGVVLLYGGEDESGAMLSDFWMMKVNVVDLTIKFTLYQPKSTYFSMIFSVREGFSLHNSPKINHPIIIGGGFGNNKQGGALLSLPNIA